MNIKRRISRLVYISSLIGLMNDDQIDSYINVTKMKLIEIPETPIHRKIVVGTVVKIKVDFIEPRHWILFDEGTHIKFLSKRSFVEWHIAKFTGVFDDLYKEENNAT